MCAHCELNCAFSFSVQSPVHSTVCCIWRHWKLAFISVLKYFFKTKFLVCNYACVNCVTFRKSCTDYSVLFSDRVQNAVQGTVCCTVCSVLYNEANCIMGDYVRNELSGEAAHRVYSVKCNTL